MTGDYFTNQNHNGDCGFDRKKKAMVKIHSRARLPACRAQMNGDRFQMRFGFQQNGDNTKLVSEQENR